MAIVASGLPHPEQVLPQRASPSGALAKLLADAALREPDRPAFRDQPGRAEWSGRPSLELSCVTAGEAVRRLSMCLLGLGVEPGARVGICLPNSTEAALSILAVEDAGLTPCLLVATASAGELSRAIEAADVRIILTQTHLGPDRLAEKLCFVAAGFFRLRFMLAFGPDVPDGVIDLDPILLKPPSGPAHGLEPGQERSGGLITFAPGPEGPCPVLRSSGSLMAAAGSVLGAARIREGDRVLSYLPPDDLRGLATGLVAALIAGATFEAHAVFRSETLAESLAGSTPTHLIVPAWVETCLDEGGLGRGLKSLVLVHEAPVRFGARPTLPVRVVDVLGFGEQALLANARQIPGHQAFEAGTEHSAEASPLLELRLNDADEICFRGPAAAVQGPGIGDDAEWRPSGFRVVRTGTVVTGIA